MADVVINTKVTPPDLNALQQLKKELKEAKAAALNGDGVAAKRVAELTDKMEDLKDETKSLQGSGVEKLNTSFGLLTQGFTNFDTDKIKTGFKGIGAAMSAMPIFLIIEGIKLLIDNFDTVLEWYDKLTGATKVQKKTAEELNAENEKQLKLMNDLVDNSAENLLVQKELSRVQNEIKDLEAAGGENQKKLNDLKRESIKLELVQLQMRKTATEKYLSESQKIALDIKIQDKEAELRRIDIVKQEEQKEKDITKNKLSEAEIRAKAASDEEAERIRQEEQLAKINKDASDARIATDTEENRIKGELYGDITNRKLALDKEATAQALAEKKARLEAERKLEEDSLKAVMAVTDVYFQMKLNATEGNEEAQTEIKRKAFEVNKAFQLGQAVIDGYRAVLSAYATAPPGFKIASAIAAGVFAAASIAKIAMTKFNAGPATMPKPAETGGASSQPSGNNVPQNNTNLPTGQSTTLDDSGNVTGGTNWISVKEINATQKRVSRVTEQARF